MEYQNKFEIIWLPLWKCNFKCPYCVLCEETNALEFQPLNTLIKLWDNLFKKIQSRDLKIELSISGGEPTIYPNFFKLLQYFMTKVSKIHVATNLSFNPYDFLNLNFSNNNICFHATFHPSCMPVDDFIKNLIPLKQYIINQTIDFVADENNLENQKIILKKLNDCGIKVKLLFLKLTGEDCRDKKVYADTKIINSESEIKMIQKIRDEQIVQGSDYELAKKVPFGKKCLAGYKSIYILPNGNITKCALDSTYLWNIFDKDAINLYQEPQICKQKICPSQYPNIID